MITLFNSLPSKIYTLCHTNILHVQYAFSNSFDIIDVAIKIASIAKYTVIFYKFLMRLIVIV